MTKRKIFYVRAEDGKPMEVTQRIETDTEEAERERLEAERERSRAYKEHNTEALLCDKCGLEMGRVYENDLNGSRFYHSHCVARGSSEICGECGEKAEKDTNCLNMIHYGYRR